MIDFAKLPNENKEQYIWRVCGAKSDGSYTGNWDSLGEQINKNLYGDNSDQYFTPQTYRKEYQTARRYYDAGVFDNRTDEKHLSQIKDEINNLYKERVKFQDQRREFNKILRNEARDETLKEELLSVAKKMAMEKPLPVNDTSYEENTEKVGLLCLSDWHYGMVTNNIWNKYNPEICKERVGHLVDWTKEYIALNKITTLHVIMLGDAAHGAIHNSCRIQANENTCDQLMHVSELLAETLSSLSECVNHIYFYSCYGNHMQIVDDKNIRLHSDNLEKIIPWWLEARLADNKKIEIVKSEYKEFTRIDLFDYKICCVHGDLDNFKSLGVTVNTIFTKIFGDTIDYTISGDKHHLEEFEQFGIESILVRSLCGSDDYANNKRLYSKAGQTFIVFNSYYGREATYHIPLSYYC